MKKVIKMVNLIIALPKTERLFKVFCQDMNKDYVRMLLHTHVRWLSKGNCLERFIPLYNTLLDFGADREDFQFLKSNESKPLISYLADIFVKLNALNKELQGEQKTLMDCKTKICGFISKLNFSKAQILKNSLSQFTHLMKCEPTDDILRIIFFQLQEMIRQICRSKRIEFSLWISQPFLFNSENNECLAMCSDQIDELMDLQNDDSVKPIHASKQQLMWLNPQVSAKYPKLANEDQQVLLPFPH